jgi:hypothetical protein
MEILHTVDSKPSEKNPNRFQLEFEFLDDVYFIKTIFFV